MYETHWRELIARWCDEPGLSRSRALEEILNGKGVPDSVRARLWVEASGAGGKKKKFPGAYDGYLRQARVLLETRDRAFSQVEMQIRKDVKRTFPLYLRKGPAKRARRSSAQKDSRSLLRGCSSSSMNSSNSGEKGGGGDGGGEHTYGVQPGWKPHEVALYNVLCALALCLDKINYHQGINYVTALLLITLHEPDASHGKPKKRTPDVDIDGGGNKKGGQAAEEREENGAKEDDSDAHADKGENGKESQSAVGWKNTEENCFWVLFSLMTEYHLRGIYEYKSSFLQQYLDQFDLLVRRFLPKLHRHLESTLVPSFPVTLFAVEWFTTVYCYGLRMDSIFLVWDLFLVARLDEALFVAGLAVLFHLSGRLLRIRSFEEMLESFKKLAVEIKARELRDAINVVVQRIVPSALIPPGRSTLAVIEREMYDSSNIFNTVEFDATSFLKAVQVGDAQVVGAELEKYRLPEALIEQALLRACFLGFPSVVLALLNGGCDATCRGSLGKIDGLTPLHVAALMGHPTVVRVLLHSGKGVDRNLRCYSEFLTPFFDHVHPDGCTPLDLAKAVNARARRSNSRQRREEEGQDADYGSGQAMIPPSVNKIGLSAVVLVLQGDVCLCCGRLLTFRKDDRNRSLASKFWAFWTSEWDQAFPRGTKLSSWSGDYCMDCVGRITRAVSATGQPQTVPPVMDVPLGLSAWHCRHCRVVTLGDRVVECKRCKLMFCASCAFTKRRLLPHYKQPVDVCQNCHHFLRSCPCPDIGDTYVVYDVFCQHSASDYIVWQRKEVFAPHEQGAQGEQGRLALFCECAQCLKRRYSLKSPLLESEPLRYDPNMPLYPCQEAIARGFWGYGDRSILSVNEASDASRLLGLIQHVEDACMTRLKFSASLLRRKDSSYVVRRRSVDVGSDRGKTRQEEDDARFREVEEALENIPQNKEDQGASADADQAAGAKDHREVQDYRDYRAELIDFYAIWNPSQISKVDALLQKYENREQELLDELNRVYVS